MIRDHVSLTASDLETTSSYERYFCPATIWGGGGVGVFTNSKLSQRENYEMIR